MKTLTEDMLLMVSAQTETELQSLIKGGKPTPREVAELAFKLNREMGMPNELAQGIIMMQTLNQLWKDESEED